MYFRCQACQHTASPRLSETLAGEVDVSCKNCGEPQTLRVPEPLRGSSRARYRAALELAERHGLDLPNAYSVLLGVCTLEFALGADESGSGSDPARAEAEGLAEAGSERRGPQRKRALYDGRFRPAIERGTLTVQQAIERGSREGFIHRLIKRHGFDSQLAARVADNDLRLADAILLWKEQRAVSLPRPAPPSPAATRRAVTLLALLLIAALVGVVGWRNWQEVVERSRRVALSPTDPAAAGLAGSGLEGPTRAANGRIEEATEGAVGLEQTEVTTDEAGRLLQVSGPNPRAVLEALCARDSAGLRLEPLELRNSTGPGRKIGVVRNRDDLAQDFAIYIRRDSRNRRWVAGNGVRPIDVVPYASLPEAPRGPSAASF